jgi:hypothetical protein
MRFLTYTSCKGKRLPKSLRRDLTKPPGGA